MKIAMIGSRGVPARWGGFETVASELAPRLVRRGHRVTVYCRPRYSLPSRPREYEGVELRYMPALYTKSLESLSHEALSAASVLFSGFDLVYVMGFRAAFLYPLMRLVGKPIVINTDGFDWQRRKWGRAARTYLRLMEVVGARWAATELVCDSRALQPYYLQEYGRSSTYIGYGANSFRSQSPSILKSYGLLPQDYLLVVARIEPENNIDTIVQAFEGLETDKQLVVVGAANYRSEYFARLKSTPDPRIRFLGGIYEPGHIEELYANAYAYVHGHEVGGTNPSLLHAMGCGCCVLAINVRFNQEVIGDAGMLWSKSPEELRELMASVLSQPLRAAALRQMSRDRVASTYDWEDVASQYDALFRSVVSRSNPVAASPVLTQD